jgi:hypothetical protein
VAAPTGITGTLSMLVLLLAFGQYHRFTNWLSAEGPLGLKGVLTHSYW